MGEPPGFPRDKEKVPGKTPRTLKKGGRADLRGPHRGVFGHSNGGLLAAVKLASEIALEKRSDDLGVAAEYLLQVGRWLEVALLDDGEKRQDVANAGQVDSLLPRQVLD